jgi:hypothetical protein
MKNIFLEKLSSEKNSFILDNLKSKLKELNISYKELAIRMGYENPKNLYPKLRGETVLNIKDITAFNMVLPKKEKLLLNEGYSLENDSFFHNIEKNICKEIQRFFISQLNNQNEISFYFVNYLDLRHWDSTEGPQPNIKFIFKNPKNNKLYYIKESYRDYKDEPIQVDEFTIDLIEENYDIFFKYCKDNTNKEKISYYHNSEGEPVEKKYEDKSVVSEYCFEYFKENIDKTRKMNLLIEGNSNYGFEFYHHIAFNTEEGEDYFESQKNHSYFNSYDCLLSCYLIAKDFIDEFNPKEKNKNLFLKEYEFYRVKNILKKEKTLE